MKHLPLILFILFLSACHAPITLPELEESIQKVMDDKKMAGMAVAVFYREKVFYSKGFGMADVEAQISYTPDTRQVLASISKLYIGVSLLKCQELGLLDLDNDINQHLPFEVVNPHFPKEKISIKHLATHTAAFKYNEQMSDEHNYEFADLGLDYLMRNFFSKEGQWYSPNNFHQKKPGDIWDYSNAGACLAAYIVEKVSKKTYDDFVKEHIFTPLKMTNTTRHFKGLERSQHYSLGTNTDFSIVERREMGLYPVGDYLTSINDLTRFFQMIMNQGELDGAIILSPSSVAELLAEHQKKDIAILDSDHDNQGIFWWHESKLLGAPPKVKGHLGGDYGIFTCAWFNPKNGLGYILFSNTGREEENIWDMVYIWQSMYKYGKKLD